MMCRNTVSNTAKEDVPHADERIRNRKRDRDQETAQIKPLITRNTIRVVLSVEPASVQKDKKWQASLGENNAIDVALKDESFLRRNDYRLDRFGKDDLLEVDLQATQTVVDGRITVDYAVLRVHEHKALSIPGTHLKFFV